MKYKKIIKIIFNIDFDDVININIIKNKNFKTLFKNYDI